MRRPFTLIPSIRNHETGREFLPAALEVLETPPNPMGRMLLAAICIAAFSGIAWAWLGKVDIIAVANGKLTSPQHTQVVQPFETASVQAILVKDGDQVQAGASLLELDKTSALAELAHAEEDAALSQLDQMRLEAFLAERTDENFSSVSFASSAEIALARQELTAQFASRDAKRLELAQEIAQRKADKETVLQTIQKIDRSLPMIQRRADIRSKAAASGSETTLQELESQQLLSETLSDRNIELSKVRSLDATIEGLEKKQLAEDADLRGTASSDFFKARDRLAAAKETIEKTEHRLTLLTVKSPIDGTVQQLHVTSIGSVVTPAQQLMSIVSKDDQLQIEAVLENRDIGFVAPGQKVEIKIDAFPFTRYGLMHGVVTSIDRDADAALPSNEISQGSDRLADRPESIQNSGKLNYLVHIALDQQRLDLDGQPAILLPGMSVEAEIMTGRRRIVEFLLNPVQQLMHDALRDR